MKVFFNSSDLIKIKGGYIFLDNDFLSAAFKDEDITAFLVDELSDCHLMVDPLTEFEFRRNVYVPEQSDKKEDYVSQSLFSPVISHQDLFLKIQQNALILSRIYTHNNTGGNSSFVDIHLAARLMYHSIPSYVITGNKKDFPSIVFDTIGFLNIEQRDNQVQTYSILQFNRAKFDECYKRLQKI